MSADVKGRSLSVRCLVAAAFLFLASCAPTLQSIADRNVEPALEKNTIVMADGARLPLRTWRAKHTSVAVVALHGFNDYSNAFAASGAWFRQRGITTYAYDQRGFGETGQRGLWPGSDVMANDLATAVDLVRRRHPGAPVYILGLSMGGAVAMKTLGQAPLPGVKGVILAAPAVWGWRAMNPFYKTALWLAAHTVPYMSATGQGLGIQASDNIEMLRALGRDPHIIKDTRIDSVYGLVTLMDEAHEASASLKTPVLYIYGQKDELVPKGPTLEVVQQITAPKRFVYYSNGWHMLLRDHQQERVWRDIAAWISNRKGRLPSNEEVRDVGKLAARGE